MATITTSKHAVEPRDDQRDILENVAWRGDGAFLKLRGERSRPKAARLDGGLILASPGHIHEIALEEPGARFVAAGSTTLRRGRRRGGVEEDETY